jgi:hypothetical protein
MEDTFNVHLTLGLVVRASTSDLQSILDFVKENQNIFLVYTKTSGGKLKIVEE